MIGRARGWMQDNPATLALVALMVGVVGTVSVVGVAIRGEETRRIVTKSPCLSSPEGKPCADLRQEVARAEPIRNPCVSYQRVTRTRGRACPKDFIDLRRQGNPELQANSKEVKILEQQPGGGAAGDATEPKETPTGNQDVGTRQPKPEHHPKTSKPAAADEASPPEPPTSATPPPDEEPGNSGETPAAQNSNGVKACVELAASACLGIDAGLHLEH